MTRPAVLGEQAPAFELSTAAGDRMTQRDLLGAPAVLVFYPADWSPVCGDQLSLYNEILPEFDRYSARLVGISVDSMWCHRAFAEDRKLRFSLLADFEPKGEVARRYGVYRQPDGTCERALFVIDAAGTIRWRYVAPLNVNPGADGILKALDTMTMEVSI